MSIIKKLYLYLENTEAVIINDKDIDSITLRDIVDEVHYKDKVFGISGYLERFKTARDVKINICNTKSNKADNIGDISIYDRLTKFLDVIAIGIEFDDYNTEEYYVLYSDDLDIGINYYQTNTYDKKNDILSIKINKENFTEKEDNNEKLY